MPSLIERINRFFAGLNLILLLAPAALIGVMAARAATEAHQEKRPKPAVEPVKVASHLIVVSISGLRADDLNQPDSLRINTPTISGLKKRGGSAVTVESVYPSLTLPAHATMATGMLPSDHGIFSDFPFDEQSGVQSTEPYRLAKEIRTDTIWDLTRRAGLTTAAVGFPLTTGAAIDFNLPINFLKTIDQGKSGEIDRSVISQPVNPPELLDQVAPFLSAVNGIDYSNNKRTRPLAQHLKLDHFKAAVAEHVIKQYSPNLLVINFHSLDRAQHRFGPASPEAFSALAVIDGLVNRLVEAVDHSRMANETVWLIASDHGSSRVEQQFRPNAVLEKKGWLKTDGRGQVISWRAVAQTFGGSAAVYVKDAQDQQTLREVEKIFGDYDQRPDSPLWRIMTRQEAARLGASPGAAFYLDAAPAYLITDQAQGPSTSGSAVRGAHGYLPSRSEMRAILIVAGKGIKPGFVIEYARLIDLAPTVARLLGLEMKTARGRVLHEVSDP